jgi:trk system potassium uptake protein TrkH
LIKGSRFLHILYILAFLILLLSLFLLVPTILAYFYEEQASFFAFGVTAVGGLILSIVLMLFTGRRSLWKPLYSTSGVLIVGLAWIVASAIGAIPFVLSGNIPSYTGAFFETMSGFTTTGASILQDIEAMDMAALFWRSLTHWLGGMGIVVLTVALLPLLGINGGALVEAESPGPSLEKVTPKIQETAKILWIIYVSLTAMETALLMLGGMNLFDAVTHSFGTLATGGFSPKANSVGHYVNEVYGAAENFNGPFIHWVITIFMILAGLNFGLMFKMLFGKWKDVWGNTEFRVYVVINIVAALAITLPLIQQEFFPDFGEAVAYASFQSASILTTTGYATADFEFWPDFSKAILFFLMFIGGSSGSTGGGIKVVRIVILFKLLLNELRYIAQPRAVHKVRLEGRGIRKDIVYGIGAFFFLYVLVLLVTTLVVASAEYDLITSFTTALATVGNIGPGFGGVGPWDGYAHFPEYVKWFLSWAMMVGRLELYTFVVLLHPRFWR